MPSPTTLDILVDYDNVDASVRRTGIASTANRILQQMPLECLQRYDAFSVRLYGGWHEPGLTMTRIAQSLSAELGRDFPSPQILKLPLLPAKTFRLDVVLADGPIDDPRLRLDGTCMKRRGMRPIRFSKPNAITCVMPATCPLDVFGRVLGIGSCTSTGCSVHLRDTTSHVEQKLVDTLIVADLLVLALVEKRPDAVLVSSDADLWPGIHVATKVGCRVLHIHTTSGARTQHRLTSTLNRVQQASYFQASV